MRKTKKEPGEGWAWTKEGGSGAVSGDSKDLAPSIAIEREGEEKWKSDWLYTVGELVAITKESESCWRKRLARGELAYLKLGASVRVKESELERWMGERIIKVIDREK